MGQRLQTQEEVGLAHAQGKTLPVQILLGALASLRTQAILAVSFPTLQPQLSLTGPPDCPTKHLLFKKKHFLLPGPRSWHILFSESPSPISPLRKTLLKVLALLW